jgi:hypothetical protein
MDGEGEADSESASFDGAGDRDGGVAFADGEADGHDAAAALALTPRSLAQYQLEALIAEAQPLPPLDDWPFEVWSISEPCIPGAVLALLHGQGVLASVGVPLEPLVRLLATIRDMYWKTNAFHNTYHGLHVAQATALLLHRTGADDPGVLPDLERFALIVAAFSHDIDHPGVGNAFLSAIEDDLALRYNDQSVLENHHAALTCELMRDWEGGTDVMSCLTLPERRRVRQVVIGAILATDMTRHFGVVIPAVKALTLPLCPARDAATGAPRPELAILKDRDRLHEIILHSADLSGQVLPWDISERWSEGIVAEFRAQARLEVAARLPYTTHMHNIDTPLEVSQLQSGFCDYVLAPLWRALADVFPVLGDRVATLEANSARYKAIIASERAAAQERAAAAAAAAAAACQDREREQQRAEQREQRGERERVGSIEKDRERDRDRERERERHTVAIPSGPVHVSSAGPASPLPAGAPAATLARGSRDCSPGTAERAPAAAAATPACSSSSAASVTPVSASGSPLSPDGRVVSAGSGASASSSGTGGKRGGGPPVQPLALPPPVALHDRARSGGLNSGAAASPPSPLRRGP